MPNTSVNTQTLLKLVEAKAPLYAPQIIQGYKNDPELFTALSEKMLNWGLNYLGDALWDDLISGYCAFVSNVNRSQMKYELKGRYEHSSYQEVYEKVYNNSSFMENYHWGVYLTTFAWEHHLKLHSFFEQQFIKLVPKQSRTAIDLGAGSGIWSMLVAEAFPSLTVTSVDISETSVHHANSLIKANSKNSQISVKLDDALKFQEEPKDIGISCFLIEHLEEPELLLKNLAKNLKPSGYAFVTAALTAAEIDHIYEIRNESELIKLAESTGFRVISSYSSAPENYPENMKYLPRSMAMVLQKKHNEIW